MAFNTKEGLDLLFPLRLLCVNSDALEGNSGAALGYNDGYRGRQVRLLIVERDLVNGQVYLGHSADTLA